MVEIKEVKTAKEKRLFATFDLKLMCDNPNMIPKIIMDELDNFNPKKNPTFEFCDVVQFLAYRDNKCVGRIAGIYHRKSNEKWQNNVVRFTRVDFTDDMEVSSALFKAIEDWGRSHGATSIIGPIGFTDLDQEGMLIEGFEYPGNFITIYNERYYVDHMLNMGFEKEVDWIEYRIEVSPEKNERLARLSDMVLRRTGTHLKECKTIKELKPYIPQIFDVLNEVYGHLFGVVELNEKQINKYVNQFLMVINPHFVKMILDDTGTLLAFGFGIPSFNNVMKRTKGRLFPFGWLRVLRSPYKKGGILDLYLVGVKTDLQSKGLPAVLLYSMAETARKNNITHAETGPELESNTQVQSLWKYFSAVQHKRRRCWKKNI